MADYKGFGKAESRCCRRLACRHCRHWSEARHALIADDQSHMKMACGDRKAAFRIAILDPEHSFTTVKAASPALMLRMPSNPMSRQTATWSRRPMHWRPGVCWFNLETGVRQPNNLERGRCSSAPISPERPSSSMLGACHARPTRSQPTMALRMESRSGYCCRTLFASMPRAVGSLQRPRSSVGTAERRRADGRRSSYRADFRLATGGGLARTLTEAGVSDSILPVLPRGGRQWTGRFNPARLRMRICCKSTTAMKCSARRSVAI